MEGTPAISGKCDSHFLRVRDAFAENFNCGKELGAAVAVTIDGHMAVDLWAGYTDPQRTRPWERDTLVNVYSTTKGMIAICVHQLVERGLLDLDERVAYYWPEFAQGGKGDMPVRYLLNHRAGLAAIEQPLPAEAIFNWDTMASAIAAQEPWWEPGSRHGYHLRTYGWLVGEIVRRVSGKESPGTYFRDEIAGPLGLGFMMPVPGAPMGPNKQAFGHPGAGGSLGFADPEARVGFGYVMNLTAPDILINERPSLIIDALFESL
jgi:CubicO group peptidase (beta-lactamase class C family)